VYEELPGWADDVTRVTEAGALPEAARRFLARIEEICDVPISLVSVGQGREQTIPWRR
jgi:adenylosuccinate synthase